MGNEPAPTMLCLASYEKGANFLRECKGQGWTVILLTVTALEQAPWPRESIDEVFHMPDLSDLTAVTRGVSYLARSRAISRIVALDDYDVETAAALREHLRLPGMGASMARHVRDKLAMRVRAHHSAIAVPAFVHLLNDGAVSAFMGRVPPPWLLKPRSEVSTIGIIRMDTADELWSRRDEVGDRHSHYLLEQYIPGAVYHVDSIIWGGEAPFAEVHQYARPPLDVFHQGGLAMTHTVPRGSADESALRRLNGQVIAALGVDQGVTHMEFIKAHEDGRFYFLEVGARVGGAFIADVVQAATGIDLWVEWARIETLGHGQVYTLPQRRHDYAACILCLARQENPDTSAYQDPAIVYRLHKPHHAGFVLASPDPERLAFLLEEYSRRFTADFYAALPPWTSRPSTTVDTAGSGQG